MEALISSRVTLDDLNRLLINKGIEIQCDVCSISRHKKFLRKKKSDKNSILTPDRPKRGRPTLLSSLNKIKKHNFILPKTGPNTEIKPSTVFPSDNNSDENNRTRFNIKQFFEENFTTPTKMEDSPIQRKLYEVNHLGSNYRQNIFPQIDQISASVYENEKMVEKHPFDLSDNCNDSIGRSSAAQSPFLALRRIGWGTPNHFSKKSSINHCDLFDNPFSSI